MTTSAARSGPSQCEDATACLACLWLQLFSPSQRAVVESERAMRQALKQSAMSAMAAVAKVGDEIALPQKRVLRLACPNPDSIAVPLLHHLICEMLSAELKAILQILSCRVTITPCVRCRMSLMCTQCCQIPNDRYIEGFLVPFQGELRSVATKAGRTHACAWIWRHLRLPHPCCLPVENQNHANRSGQNIHRMMGSRIVHRKT